MALSVQGNLVFNTSNDWYKCYVSDSNHKTKEIPVIPPQSARKLPDIKSGFSIKNSIKLTQDQIGMYTKHSPSFVPIPIEPIDINLSGFWSGTLKIDEKEAEFNGCVSILSSSISVWFLNEDIMYVLNGTLNVKTHQIKTRCVSSSMKVFPVVNGVISKTDNGYSIEMVSDSISITASIDSQDAIDFEPDSKITGEYLAFYSKRDNEYEMNLHLISSMSGLISGECIEDHKKSNVFGAFDSGTCTFLIFREFQERIQIFTGSAEIEHEIFISGLWKDSQNEGQFTFSKAM